jgi:hypothetical protein
MSSAVCTACALSALDVARLNSSVRASGEFIVIVVAVCMRAVSSHSSLERTNKQRTERASHGADPTFFAAASVRRRSYTERMCGGAGRVLGRAKGAAMRAFSAGESFDMRIYILYIEISIYQYINHTMRGERDVLARSSFAEDGGKSIADAKTGESGRAWGSGAAGIEQWPTRGKGESISNTSISTCQISTNINMSI